MILKHYTVHEGFQEVLLYTTPDGKVKVEMFLQNETIWLTQQKIADLFGIQRPAVTKHLKNIFKSGELQEDSVCSILEHTAADSKSYATQFYNMDAIISVGYRVNSIQATHFRIWATERFKEYIIKGFTMDNYPVFIIWVRNGTVRSNMSGQSQALIRNLTQLLISTLGHPEQI